MIFMRSLSIVVMSQIKLISTPSWLVYFVLKAQPFFINFGDKHTSLLIGSVSDETRKVPNISTRTSKLLSSPTSSTILPREAKPSLSPISARTLKKVAKKI
jgi:hypothetical protein